MYMKRGVALCAGLVGLVGVSAGRVCAQGQSTGVRAREVVAQLPRQDSARARQAGHATERRVTLDLHQVAVKDALREVAKQGGVVLFYNDHDIPAKRRVSVRIENATVMDALDRVLHGTGLAARVTGAGVVIERGAARPLRADSLDLDEQQGSIHGRVTDAKTGEGIGGASVTIEGTGLGAITGDSGDYRIGGLAPGQHTVRAKRLGYERTSQTVMVADGQDTELDFALAVATTMLDQVVVTGTVVPTEVKAVPTPISVITAADIERSGVNHVEQLFRGAIPGVIAPDHGEIDMYPHIYMRGGTDPDPNNVNAGLVKTLVDGVEVANFTSISQIDPATIDRIEVVRGPQASTLYGSGAISGVIQIFTKKGTVGRPRISAEAAAGTVQGEYGSGTALHQEYSAGVSGGVSGFTYRVGASYLSAGKWLPGYHSDRTVYSGSLRRIEGPVTVDLMALYSDHQFHYIAPLVTNRFSSGAWTTGNPAIDRTIALPDHRLPDVQEQTYGANITYDATSWWEHRLVLGYDRPLTIDDQNASQGASPADTLLGFFHSPASKISYGYNTTMHGRAGVMTGSLTLGLDRWRYTTSSVVGQKFAGKPVAGTVSATASTYSNSGYYAQAQVGVRDALFFTAGVRAERNDNFGSAYKTATSPRVGVSYMRRMGAVTLKARTSYGKAIRAPQPEQKEGGPPGPVSVKLANPFLKPEVQSGYDAGIDVYFGTRASFQATYYHQLVDQMIAYNKVSDPGVVPRENQYQNIGRVRNAGLELQASIRLMAPVTVSGTYSIAHSTMRTLEPGIDGDGFNQYHLGDQLHGVPIYSGGLNVSYAAHRTTASLGATYIASMQNYDLAAHYALLYGGVPPRPSGRDYLMMYPSVVKFNLNVQYELSSHLSGLLRVDNVAGSRAFEVDNLTPAHGRLMVIGVRVTQ